MSEEIFKFVSSTFGISAAVTLAIIALALWLTHYVTKKVTEIKCEHESIKAKHLNQEETVRSMATDLSMCTTGLKSVEAKHHDHDETVRIMTSDLSFCKASLKSVDKIVEDLGEIRRDMSYLKGTIDIIKGGSNPLMASHSPVALTKEGEAVVDELKGREIVRRNRERIMRELSSVGEKTPYDIQQYCIESVSVEPERYFITEDLNSIKRYAFSKGQPLQLYLRVLGLLIRDLYFAEKGINLSEIDN